MNYEYIETKLNLINPDREKIGKSVLSEPIYSYHIGDNSENQILITGGIHAREWISTLLIIELINHYAKLKFNGGIYFVPLCNPDGVRLALNGASDPAFKAKKEFLTQINDGSENFTFWKANANAVDLNVNFDALWGGGKHNVKLPGPQNFIGTSPNSEPEVNALINYTKKIKPKLTISYHSKGEVIYYGFEKLSPKEIERDKKLCRIFSKITGYKPEKTKESTGGFSDWISQHLKVPAFTFELGNDMLSHPISRQQLAVIFAQNKDIPLKALEIVSDKKHKRLFQIN